MAEGLEFHSDILQNSIDGLKFFVSKLTSDWPTLGCLNESEKAFILKERLANLKTIRRSLEMEVKEMKLNALEEQIVLTERKSNIREKKERLKTVQTLEEGYMTQIKETNASNEYRTEPVKVSKKEQITKLKKEIETKVEFISKLHNMIGSNKVHLNKEKNKNEELLSFFEEKTKVLSMLKNEVEKSDLSQKEVSKTSKIKNFFRKLF